MVSILHRYVLRQLIRSFVMSLLVLTIVMVLGAIYRPLRHGLGFVHLARFLPYMLPHLLAWVIPAATLAACVMTYGRLSADSELIATSVSGIPLRYMVYPTIATAAVLTAATIPLNGWIIPRCRARKRAELQRIFLEEPFRISLIGGQETIEIGDHKIYIESVEGNTLHNVLVIAPREGKDTPSSSGARPRGKGDGSRDVYVYRAQQARYTVDPEAHAIRIVLEQADYTIVQPERKALQWLGLKAEQQVLTIRTEDPLRKLHERKRSNLTRPELNERAAQQRRELASATGAGERAALETGLTRTLTELYLRDALAFSTLALSFVGVPLGIWIRRESRLASFAIAVFVFLLLYALIAGGEGLALRQRLAPHVALWTPDALTAALGIAMLLHLFRR